jgi:hypothetical protein
MFERLNDFLARGRTESIAVNEIYYATALPRRAAEFILLEQCRRGAAATAAALINHQCRHQTPGVATRRLSSHA